MLDNLFTILKNKASLVQKNDAGFTLAELLVAIVIGILILSIVTSTFILSQRVLRKSNLKAELAQNGRITLDLMSREIRQANEIITVLPTTDSSAPSELEFEDGHTNTHIQYIKYYLSGTNLKRQIIGYYFSAPPPPIVYVYWDDVDAFGPPTSTILDDQIIGENFNDIDFWGNSNINIELILIKQIEKIEMKSVINPRNS